jgi:Protein of unknown function (DUF1360)
MIDKRKSPNSRGLESAMVDALATYRLVRLLQVDSITESVRNRLMKRHGATKQGQLIDCPWCLSPYVAALVLAARAISPRLWDIAARVLAFSAMTGIASSAVARLEED